MELQTERLALRHWRDEHREPFAALNADPVVMEYFPATMTREASDRFVDALRAHFDQHGWGNWAVETRATGELIGFVGLTIPRRQYAFSPCVEVGWRLATPYWGKGYATEAARAALRHGFETLALDEIVSFTALLNMRSRAVMERIGMTNANEDFEHPALEPGHKLRPHCLYRLSRARWRLANP